MSARGTPGPHSDSCVHKDRKPQGPDFGRILYDSGLELAQSVSDAAYDAVYGFTDRQRKSVERGDGEVSAFADNGYATFEDWARDMMAVPGKVWKARKRGRKG